jgi:hypothetical protein
MAAKKKGQFAAENASGHYPISADGQPISSHVL